MVRHMSVLARLRSLRLAAIRDELSDAGVDARIPDQYLTNFVNFVGAAEQVHVTASLIGEPPRRVLVVGTFGGRDFWGLRARGYDVTGMNLTPDLDCPPTVVADAEGEWPFESASFDAIVAGEILEHLFEDRAALREARRVLRPAGALVVTVPFVHDGPEYHVRVHTRQSIRRLLEHSGFAVQRIVERPGLPLKRPLTTLVNATNLARHAVGVRTRFSTAARVIGDLELKLGERPSTIRRALGALGIIPHGCTLLARASTSDADYKSLNVEAFRVD